MTDLEAELLQALKDLHWAVDGIAYVQEEYAEQVQAAARAIQKAESAEQLRQWENNRGEPQQ